MYFDLLISELNNNRIEFSPLINNEEAAEKLIKDLSVGSYILMLPSVNPIEKYNLYMYVKYDEINYTRYLIHYENSNLKFNALLRSEFRRIKEELKSAAEVSPDFTLHPHELNPMILNKMRMQRYRERYCIDKKMLQMRPNMFKPGEYIIFHDPAGKNLYLAIKISNYLNICKIMNLEKKFVYLKENVKEIYNRIDKKINQFAIKNPTLMVLPAEIYNHGWFEEKITDEKKQIFVEQAEPAEYKLFVNNISTVGNVVITLMIKISQAANENNVFSISQFEFEPGLAFKQIQVSFVQGKFVYNGTHTNINELIQESLEKLDSLRAFDTNILRISADGSQDTIYSSQDDTVSVTSSQNDESDNERTERQQLSPSSLPLNNSLEEAPGGSIENDLLSEINSSSTITENVKKEIENIDETIEPIVSNQANKQSKKLGIKRKVGFFKSAIGEEEDDLLSLMPDNPITDFPDLPSQKKLKNDS